MKKTISVRMDETLLKKVRMIAEDGGRTVSGYICYVIRKNIEKFEKEHPFPNKM